MVEISSLAYQQLAHTIFTLYPHSIEIRHYHILMIACGAMMTIFLFLKEKE